MFRSFSSYYELNREPQSSESIAKGPTVLLVPCVVVEDVDQLGCQVLCYFHWLMSPVLRPYSGLGYAHLPDRVLCVEL
jgi:hypothetical protein